MRKVRYLHTPHGSIDLYFRRKVPEDVRSLSTATSSTRYRSTRRILARRRQACRGQGEFEKKLAMFRQALERGDARRLSDDKARAVVEQYLTGRSGSGFASGGLTTAFILRELYAEMDEIEGSHIRPHNRCCRRNGKPTTSG